jgi:hypothetical protein
MYHGIGLAICKGPNARWIQMLGFGWLYCAQQLEHTGGAYHWRIPAFIAGINQQFAYCVDAEGIYRGIRKPEAIADFCQPLLTQAFPNLQLDTLLVPYSVLKTSGRYRITEDSLRSAWPYPIQFVALGDLRNMAQYPAPHKWYLWVNRGSMPLVYIAPLGGGPIAYLADYQVNAKRLMKLLRGAANGQAVP